MNIQKFISGNKTLLIAPAGYGKTHTLAECILYTPENEKQLILTHTHAGIISIKDKLKKLNVPTRKYHIETITGFSQRYVLAYYCDNNIPAQEDSNNYYPFIIKKAKELFQFTAVKRTVQYSYQGLFVDEYQDCTKSQHEMLMVLSEILPIHILGDSMQGIFGFKEPLVCFEKDLNDFEKVEELEIPWRWIKDGNNKQLGDNLKNIRNTLDSRNKTINLSEFDSINFIVADENDIYSNQSNLRQTLNSLITNRETNSLLLIFPEYINKNNGRNIPKGGINDRGKIKTQIDYSNQLILLEAIDAKDFYSITKIIDDLVLNISRKRKKIKSMNDNLFTKLFNKSNLNDWIKDDRLINKGGDKSIIKNKLEEKINSFIVSPSIKKLLDIIFFMKKDMKFKTKRYDLLNSIIKSMNIAISEKMTVYEAMVSHKNIVRRVGRKIHGKCIGTTLLTKGLEFDTVAILNAHRIEDYKHFYVAVTRACKKLVVFSEKNILQFN